jgi:hypothetical protein
MNIKDHKAAFIKRLQSDMCHDFNVLKNENILNITETMKMRFGNIIVGDHSKKKYKPKTNSITELK